MAKIPLSLPLGSTILVTGANGYIASHVVNELLRFGYHVKGTVRTTEASLHNVVPVYMVPSMFLPLVTVPLTASGKINRRLLHDHTAALSQSEMEAYNPVVVKRAPATASEQKLQWLWSQVLKIVPSDTIGADDNFFRLGGDSIIAMKLASAAREAGLSLTVPNVLKYPTLSEKAASTFWVSDHPLPSDS